MASSLHWRNFTAINEKNDVIQFDGAFFVSIFSFFAVPLWAGELSKKMAS